MRKKSVRIGDQPDGYELIAQAVFSWEAAKVDVTLAREGLKRAEELEHAAKAALEEIVHAGSCSHHDCGNGPSPTAT